MSGATAPQPTAIGLRFTERMSGSVTPVDSASDQPLEFVVTISADDLNRFLASADHLAGLTGTVSSPIFGDAVPVTGGTFQLFVDDPTGVNTRHLNYTLSFSGRDGRLYTLVGQKTVRDDHGPTEIWTATTTLAVKLYQNSSASGNPLATGTMHLSPTDFFRELGTFEVLRAPDEETRLRCLARFGKFFAGKLYDTYGGLFLHDRLFDPDAPPRQKRPLACGAPVTHWVTTSDGLKLRLNRYGKGRKGPVLLVHGLGVSSLIFSIDTIDVNLLEYLYQADYDVWLLDCRASIELPYAVLPYTADDIATQDFPAAVDYVRRATGAQTLQCVVHCFGANTFCMAMLAGLQGVRSAVISQTATHLRVPYMTHVKALFHAPDVLEMFGVEEMDAYVDTHASWEERLFDHLLRFYPVHDGPRDTNPVSRRISFIYGQLYELDNLNQLTYDNLHELFGVAGIKSLQQLALMIRAAKIVQADGADAYLKEADGYPTLKRLAIPIRIIHGEKNRCWLPESTEITYELLRKHNDPGLYSRDVITGYGHIDCIFGARAAADVYPHIVDHLDKTALNDPSASMSQ